MQNLVFAISKLQRSLHIELSSVQETLLCVDVKSLQDMFYLVWFAIVLFHMVWLGYV